MWKLRNFTSTIFSEKFRENNVLITKELYSKLIWWKNICMAVNFSFFHTVCSSRQKLSIINPKAHLQSKIRQIDWKRKPLFSYLVRWYLYFVEWPEKGKKECVWARKWSKYIVTTIVEAWKVFRVEFPEEMPHKNSWK